MIIRCSDSVILRFDVTFELVKVSVQNFVNSFWNTLI